MVARTPDRKWLRKSLFGVGENAAWDFTKLIVSLVISAIQYLREASWLAVLGSCLGAILAVSGVAWLIQSRKSSRSWPIVTIASGVVLLGASIFFSGGTHSPTLVSTPQMPAITNIPAVQIGNSNSGVILVANNSPGAIQAGRDVNISGPKKRVLSPSVISEIQTILSASHYTSEICISSIMGNKESIELANQIKEAFGKKLAIKSHLVSWAYPQTGVEVRTKATMIDDKPLSIALAFMLKEAGAPIIHYINQTNLGCDLEIIVGTSD